MFLNFSWFKKINPYITLIGIGTAERGGGQKSNFPLIPISKLIRLRTENQHGQLKIKQAIQDLTIFCTGGEFSKFQALIKGTHPQINSWSNCIESWPLINVHQVKIPKVSGKK